MESVSQLRETAKQKKDETVGKLTDEVTSAGKAVEEYFDQAKMKAEEWFEKGNGFMKKHPTETLLVGFGAGLMLGMVSASLFRR